MAALDMLLVFTVIFVLAYFAAQRTIEQGAKPDMVAVERLTAQVSGDFATLHFLSIRISANGVSVEEFRNGGWVRSGSELGFVDIEGLELILKERALPVVIYEDEPSPYFGDVVRAAASSGLAVGIATVQ